MNIIDSVFIYNCWNFCLLPEAVFLWSNSLSALNLAVRMNCAGGRPQWEKNKFLKWPGHNCLQFVQFLIAMMISTHELMPNHSILLHALQLYTLPGIRDQDFGTAECPRRPPDRSPETAERETSTENLSLTAQFLWNTEDNSLTTHHMVSSFIY